MFPELDDLTYAPQASSVLLQEVKVRGDSLRRRRRFSAIGIPAAIATALILSLLPWSALNPVPEPAAPPHPLGHTVTVFRPGAPTIVSAPLEQGADVAVIVDLAPGPRLAETLWVAAGSTVRQVPAGDTPQEPSLSPDGRFVAYRAHFHPFSVLTLVNLTSGLFTELEVQGEPAYSMESGNQLWWSADGSVLADGYWEMTERGQAISPRVRIWHVSDDGTISGPVADGPVPGGLLGLSPGGDQLLALGGQGEVLASATSQIAFRPTGTRAGLSGSKVRDVMGAGFSPDGDSVGALVKVADQKTSGSAYYAWVLDLLSRHTRTVPLPPEYDYQWTPPAGWSGPWLAGLDAGSEGVDPVVVRLAQQTPRDQVLLTFRPAGAQVDWVSLATGRVYYSPRTAQ